ncbi:MAG TPA: SDR family oxidoreductase [Anditalea sp.]|nr:SDR family oxidoreductase [Anditalea sp.]
MGKILVAGATGSLGSEVIKALHARGYPSRALVHNVKNIDKIKNYTDDIIIADARKPNQLLGLCKDIDILISTVGKSISLFKNDSGTYDSIDYNANINILTEAENSGVKRVLFTSIMGCNENNRLKLAKVHYRVEKHIAEKFENHTILRPTGFFSGLNDLVILGKKGLIPVIGKGNFRSNPIHQRDLARVIIDMVHEGPRIVELGGPEIHTRKEMAYIIQKKTGGKIIHLPELLVKSAISIIRLIKPSLYHNMDYFRYVTTRDMVGKRLGGNPFNEYLDKLDLNDLP